jgi:hypothetical protein
MAENKTRKTGEDPREFIARIEDPARRRDCTTILNLLQEVTGSKPEMWGPGIVGFGSYKYKSGKNMNDWFLTGFAARKDALTIYLMSGFGHYPELVGRLGKHKTGVGCLYVKKLDDIDVSVLRELVTVSTADMKKNYLPGE